MTEDSTPKGRHAALDAPLLLAMLVLLGIGVVMVYSASAVFAAKTYDRPAYFLARHLLWAVLGVGALAFGARADFGIWRKLAAPLLLISVVLLGLCLVPGLGVRVGGAARWLRLGPLSVQPSEIAKFALVTYLAIALSRRVAPVGAREVAARGEHPLSLLPPALISVLLVLLVLGEPDLGTAALLAGTALFMFFAAGARMSYLALAVLSTAPLVYQRLIVGTPWRMRRLLAFIDPWAYRRDVGYQISESLISVGSGGIFGTGLGEGKQKLFFLPEAHTDFVFAVIGEELGLIGLTFVLLCFGVILWRGVRAALRARDLFGTYLAFGITAAMLLGALVHMGVVVGLLPTKGTTLPLVSYGGSSLVATVLMGGVLLSIASGRAEPPELRLERGARQGNQRVRFGFPVER